MFKCMYMILLVFIGVGCGKDYNRPKTTNVIVDGVQVIGDITIVNDFNRLTFVIKGKVVGEIRDVKMVYTCQLSNTLMLCDYLDLWDRRILLGSEDLKVWRVYRMNNPHSGVF